MLASGVNVEDIWIKDIGFRGPRVLGAHTGRFSKWEKLSQICKFSYGSACT